MSASATNLKAALLKNSVAIAADLDWIREKMEADWTSVLLVRERPAVSEDQPNIQYEGCRWKHGRNSQGRKADSRYEQGNLDSEKEPSAQPDEERRRIPICGIPS